MRVPFAQRGMVGEGSSVLEACVQAFAAVRTPVVPGEVLGLLGFGLDSKRPALRLLLPLRGTQGDAVDREMDPPPPTTFATRP